MENFYATILVPAHGILALMLLLAMLTAVTLAIPQWKKSESSMVSLKFYKWTFILSHVQLLIGLTSYFLSPKVNYSEGFMKNEVLRLYAVEHPFVMILSIVLVSIAYFKLRSSTYPNRKIFWFYISAFILIASRLPYGYFTFMH